MPAIMNPIDRSNAVRVVEVDSEQAGQRLDNFLITRLKGVPRSRVYRIVRRGEVRVNGARAQPAYRLRQGDRVRIPPLRTPLPAERIPVTADVPALGQVLYEDDHLLVLDKPAGMAVHGGTGIRAGLIELLRAARPNCRYLELVHRLDRETSGCLLVAKRRAALTALHADLRQNSVKTHRFEKRYVALVAGAWEGGARTVDIGLRRDRPRSGDRVVVAEPEGRYARSVFRPRARYRSSTLVEITLYTGRTHQARVHAAHSGHPIAGDTKYGDRNFNALMRGFGLRRLFLHAARVSFVHPASGQRLEIEAPLPPSLGEVIDRLEEDAVSARNI